MADTRSPFHTPLHVLDWVIYGRRGPPALLLQKRIQFLQKRSFGEAGARSDGVQQSILVPQRSCQWTHPHRQAEEDLYADTPGGVIRQGNASLVMCLPGQVDLGGATL